MCGKFNFERRLKRRLSVACDYPVYIINIHDNKAKKMRCARDVGLMHEIYRSKCGLILPTCPVAMPTCPEAAIGFVAYSLLHALRKSTPQTSLQEKQSVGLVKWHG